MINLVQLGANAGDDHVSDFIQHYTDIIDYSLLVEPIASVADKCRNFYKGWPNNIAVHACAVAKENGEAELTYVEGTNLRLSSLVPGLHSDFMNTATKTMMVPTLTFDSLFAKHGLNKVDVLFVDCEGIDEDLLIDYDFNKYQTNYICWEWNHNARRNPNQHNLLKEKLIDNMFIIETRGMNKIACRIGSENYRNTLK